MHFLIPAAGSGSRMKAGKNKLLIDLEGESLIIGHLNLYFLQAQQIGLELLGNRKIKTYY